MSVPNTPSTIAALQTLHAGITGIKSAPTAYPASLGVNQLPLVVVWPGPATSERHGYTELGIQERLYMVRVYVAPVPQGILNTLLQTTIALMDRFVATYLDGDNVILSNGAELGTENIRDSGLDSGEGNTVLVYAGVQYHGFQFQVPIREHW
jgi:hypothetical protein